MNRKYTKRTVKSMLSLCLGTLLLSTLHAYAVPKTNGVAIHTEFGAESFIAALLTETFSTSNKDVIFANEDKQIQVRVLADRISSYRFRNMWIEGIAINAANKELSDNATSMAKFSNLLKIKLRKGDVFIINRTKAGMTVVINDTVLGKIDDPKFFDLILRVWIGPVPLSSEFREGLLAGGKVSPSLLSRLDSVQPTKERSAAIAAAVAKRLKQTVDAATKTAATAADAAKTAGAAGAVASAPQIASAPKPKETPKAPTPTEAPKATPSPVAVAKVTPKPVQKATKKPVIAKKTPAPQPIAKADAAFAGAQDESVDIFDLEDDENFTAESLLARQLYISKLRRWTNQERRYPSASITANEQGLVRLDITVLRDGSVKQVKVTEAPPYKRLVKAAKNAVKRATPYPPIPKEIIDDEFIFTLPFAFKLVE